MGFSFVSTLTIFWILVYLLGLGGCICFFYKGYQKYLKRFPERTFSDFLWRDLEDPLIPIVLTIALTFLLLLTVAFNGSSIYHNRINEAEYYTTAVVRAETIDAAIEVSEDIINTELYLDAIEFNKELAEVKSKFNNPHYKMNFTGEYDWNELEYIELRLG
jgi:hypothetical protein